MSAFTLHTVTETDIPSLTTIGSVTFLHDRHTQFKAAHPTNPYDHAAGIPEGICKCLAVPRRVVFLKAVDNATGEILGSVVWASRGFDLNPDATAPATPPTTAPADPKTQDKNRIGTDYVVDESPELDAVARLGEHTNGHFAAFQRKMMPEGSRCMYIAGINVHPAHQRRGVGRALVDAGMRRADEEGVPCWVHSSEAGQALFQGAGWEVDETLVVDLDEVAGEMKPVMSPPQGEDRWGTYTFQYFVRQPGGE